jgi:hypothetical protein
VAGVGFGTDGTCGLANNRVAGVSQNLKNSARTASRLRSTNGCSW